MQVLTLSTQIFKWERGNEIDSLQAIFHDKFFVTGSDGSSQAKAQNLTRSRSGDFIHHSITVEENTAIWLTGAFKK